MDTKTKMWQFMLDYQEEWGQPPLMRELVEQFATMGHNSSVRHNMRLLVSDELVLEVGAEGSPRRYEAVGVEDVRVSA